MFKEVFCKDTQFLRKGKARACESLDFVVNKKETISKHVFEEIKNKKRMCHELMTHPLLL